MLSDKEIEKRMVEALEEGGRHTMDDLLKSTGIDRERIGKALYALEEEELIAHITLEGTPRFYMLAAKDPPKKPRKKADKVPCPVCGELRSPMGLWRHVRACKAKEKASRAVPDQTVKIEGNITMNEGSSISVPDGVTVTMPMGTTITMPPTNYLPGIERPPETEHDRGVRVQDLGELIGEKHWDNFLGAEKRHEYINGFQHGFKHGYEHRIKEEEDVSTKG